jgi:hypothetical protein
MKFNTKEVIIRDVTFEVRELSVRDLMPIIKMLNDDAEEGQNQLMAKSVYIDGVQIGDAFGDLPASAMMELVPHVMSVNSLDGEEEGND